MRECDHEFVYFGEQYLHDWADIKIGVQQTRILKREKDIIISVPKQYCKYCGIMRVELEKVRRKK